MTSCQTERKPQAPAPNSPELAAPREDCIQGLLLLYPFVSLPGVHRRPQGEEGGLPKPADVWAGISCPWCLTAAEMGGRPAAAASQIQAGLESRKRGSPRPGGAPNGSHTFILCAT